jgi:hypothetical protein
MSWLHFYPEPLHLLASEKRQRILSCLDDTRLLLSPDVSSNIEAMDGYGLMGGTCTRVGAERCKSSQCHRRPRSTRAAARGSAF